MLGQCLWYIGEAAAAADVEEEEEGEREEKGLLGGRGIVLEKGSMA